MHHYNDDQSILIVRIWISYFFIKYSLNLVHVKLYVVGLMELLYKTQIGLTTSYWNSFLSDYIINGLSYLPSNKITDNTTY